MRLTTIIHCRSNKLLLRRGATLERGMLLLAAGGASVEICKICLSHGDDPNMMLDYGRTPLHALFADGYRGELEPCCRLLLDHDANPNARTTARFQDLSTGSTPLHLVAGKLNKALRDSDEEDEEGWRSVYNMLLSAGADPNLANEDGLTPDMIVKGRSAPQKSSQK
ncbi:MAG: ankyrin repeat domain-containing protein [Akkermansia muciniphila]